MLPEAAKGRRSNLDIPASITLLHLPPPVQAGGRLYSPELNPAENIWEYLRGNKLAITVFDDYNHIVETCCAAWNFFASDSDAIASITTRAWAQVSV